ncbi:MULTISPECIES: hypothetical protein [Okeania]|uniref:hypothetical protein n=1 Tax=Okeania TaxID=1458928 RepID=UPI001374D026|nr:MULTISPECIES: hypothetical protein [Okeania]NEP41407.1 hypothetical protein [Okeania sp. SIO2H7]NET14519.1 hypothetical protein [Okeania sp. SIO1H6]NEP75267.1 hypothetical protein [Okeania sp. SIO2G5]NEP96343.1 hypothetical protein [Okeania sp. SIO2F5]NEQ94067.1 hypothetical protein [Okeania sp. SIO2G4]
MRTQITSNFKNRIDGRVLNQKEKDKNMEIFIARIKLNYYKSSFSKSAAPKKCLLKKNS